MLAVHAGNRTLQVFGPSTSPLITGIGVGTGPGAYTDLLNKYAKTLASGSTASLDDQLAAWTNAGSLALSRNNEDGGLLYDINKNDFKRAMDLYNDSDLAKSMQKVDRQFNDSGLVAVRSSDGGDFNVAQNKLDNLARFSQDDQKKIFFAENLNVPGAYVIGGKDIYYADLNGWKADLKQQSATFNAQQQDAAASSTADPAAVSGAVSKITTALTQATKPKPASQTATAAAAAATTAAANADIALQLLLTSQDVAQRPAAAARTANAGASAYVTSQASSSTANVHRTASAWM